MSDPTNPPIPNPDEMPASPALERTDDGEYVLDPRRLPSWGGSCPSCEHFQAMAIASESKQVYVDKHGKKKQRLFTTWERFCLAGPEHIQIGDADIVYCSKYALDSRPGTFAELIKQKTRGNTPFATDEEE